MDAIQPQDAIDLARYPIEDLESARAKALIADCQAGLKETGACVLDGFVPPDRVAGAVAEVEGNLGEAFYKTKQHNPYLIPDDPAFPADHPRNRRLTTNSATLGYDLIPRGCTLDGIYNWPPLRAFIARVLGYDALYPYTDPLSPLNILVYQPGTGTNWHFDNANFVVTLMLQQSEAGGLYQYAPFIRGDGHDNYDAIGRVLDGVPEGVLELKQDPGALVLFQGQYTLHRVTPVEGAADRLVAVFTYHPEPGMRLAEHTRKTFYGRAA